jgi:hypothetical protein
LKNQQIGIPIQKFRILKKMLCKNSVHLILYQKTIAITFPVKITMVAAISTSTQNGCPHLCIYSKWLPPSLHLLKKVAAISKSTQNGCRHPYIYSTWLPPYLHLLKTIAAISTTTQNSSRHLYINSKRVDVIMVGQKKEAGTFSDS